jgi:divalent metal cation (Fe/Co/Zn/Cd) transporter
VGGFNKITKIGLGLVVAAVFFIFFHIFSAGGDSFFESLKDSVLAVAISALFIALIIFLYFLMTKLQKKGTDGQEIYPEKP